MKLLNAFIFSFISIVSSAPLCDPSIKVSSYEECKNYDTQSGTHYCCKMVMYYETQEGMKLESGLCFPISVKQLIQPDNLINLVKSKWNSSDVRIMDVKFDCGQSIPNGIYVRFSIFYLIILLLLN